MARSSTDLRRAPRCGRISMAQSTGVSVRATTALITMEPAMVMENWR